MSAVVVLRIGNYPQTVRPGAFDWLNQSPHPHRFVVRYLPEVEAWAKQAREAGVVVQYALLLERPVRQGERCYWPVEVRAGEALWRRYLVAPDGALRN